ncbi:MAG: UPF0280 family protein [Candidatus Omnitrophica bacterium]|jgi:ApbE superfamily uncharacterized protein (UPF0280 family)|nr:UPF0280 family protein [Candidatus Omnitrophota bacterium]
MQYTEKFYRRIVGTDLTTFSVKIEESDLYIMAEKNLSLEAEKELKKQRQFLKQYIIKFPEFYYSFTPVKADESAPEIVKMMSQASFLCEVGPMATVAGAIAEMVGKYLLNFTDEVIIENGGDIFLKIKKERTVAIYAGNNPFSLKIGIKVKPKEFPFGVATSSATVGHSTSFGKADSVTVICPTSTLADGLATFMCNQTSDEDFSGIKKNIEKFPFVDGIVAVKNEKIFAWGNIELVYIK